MAGAPTLAFLIDPVLSPLLAATHQLHADCLAVLSLLIDDDVERMGKLFAALPEVRS